MQHLVEDGTFANNSDLIRAGIRRVLEERGVV
jgi:Arc/MetJ-type ribon-helix-helix transcriptional regulator